MGTTAVVTGANSGLGYHTALELLRHGADVVLAARDPGKARQAADQMSRDAKKEPGVAGTGPRRPFQHP